MSRLELDGVFHIFREFVAVVVVVGILGGHLFGGELEAWEEGLAAFTVLDEVDGLLGFDGGGAVSMGDRLEAFDDEVVGGGFEFRSVEVVPFVRDQLEVA